MIRRNTRILSWAAIVVVVGAALVLAESRVAPESGEPAIEFSEVRRQTLEFIAYDDSITLTPEQEAVKKEALSAIPAPCCSDNTAETCCCPCNMAKSIWGLTKHLIADEGYSAVQVRKAVEGWIEFINPAGFSGDVCYTGGCRRPFHRNGCGGMDKTNVVF